MVTMSERPKRSYRIGEIAKLFGIGIDSLRYYERIGILSPRREVNGYRTYALEDMCRIALIKELRRLDVPMQQIKDYVDDQTVEGTVRLIGREIELVDQRIEELQERKRTMRERLEGIERAQVQKTGGFSLVHHPARRCVELAARLERDEEMDFAIQRLHKRHEDEIPHLGTLAIGAFLSTEDLCSGKTNIYEAVFFVLPDDAVACDFELSAGPYLTYWYRGSYQQNGTILNRMLRYADEHALNVVGDPFEIYAVDNRDTSVEEEFLTRVELPVALPCRAGSK